MNAVAIPTNDLQWPNRFALCLSLVFILLALVLTLTPVRASTNRQIVIDPATGMALYGYDPVSYFVTGEAREGKPEFERRWAGVTWRFVNPGNMQAFFDAPTIYCPRYGGYGALSVARGLTTPGKPVFFTLHEGKLYFFYSRANRHIWLETPGAYIEEANRNWTNVKQQLAR